MRRSLENMASMMPPVGGDVFWGVAKQFEMPPDAERVYTTLQNTASAINSLIGIKSYLISRMDNGIPLTKDSAKLLQIATEAALRPLLIEERVVFPSMEHYDNRQESLSATRIALENISDYIKRHAVHLGELIMKLWEKIKEFFQQIFGRRAMAVKHLEAVLETVEKIPDDASPSEEHITSLNVSTEDSNSVKFLDNNILFNINGRCNAVTAASIVDNTMTLLEVNREIILEMMHCLDIIEDKVTQEQLVPLTEKLVHEIKGSFSKFTMTQRKSEGHQMVYSYGYFHDSHLFKIREDVGKKSNDDDIRLFNLDFLLEKAKAPEYKVDVLSKKEMADLGVMVLRLVEKSKDFEKIVPKIQYVLKDTADSLHHRFTGDSDKEEKNDILASLALMSDIVKYVRKYLPAVSANAVKVATDATTYVRASVARYKQT